MGQAFENTGAAWLGAEESTLRGAIVDHPILSRYAGTNEQLDEQVQAARDVQQGGHGLPERLRNLDV